jgi:hypothetical protein
MLHDMETGATAYTVSKLKYGHRIFVKVGIYYGNMPDPYVETLYNI